jgi:hypothetical protein
MPNENDPSDRADRQDAVRRRPWRTPAVIKATISSDSRSIPNQYSDVHTTRSSVS